jgi:hypothetical protein
MLALAEVVSRNIPILKVIAVEAAHRLTLQAGILAHDPSVKRYSDVEEALAELKR